MNRLYDIIDKTLNYAHMIKGITTFPAIQHQQEKARMIMCRFFLCS